jgi:alkylation response protein AidB-like acyl-CoA dehydrogenase
MDSKADTTAERELLRGTVRSFVQERSPVARLRELREDPDGAGFSRELWRELAELGMAGLPFPEEYGGGNFGFAELGIVLEECGRMLVASPYLSTVLLAGSAVLLGGTEAQRKDLLPGVCAGTRLLALALQEGPHHDPCRVATEARATGAGWRIHGEKVFVLDGHVADRLVVVARTSGAPCNQRGLTLFVVPAGAPGLRASAAALVDGRRAASLRFEAVEVGPGDVLGALDAGAELLERVLDRAVAGLCAEMLGSCREAFERTLAYLKQRRQFGVPIGSFQALQHRAARLACEIELARAIVHEALAAVDAERPELPLLVSAAKARCSDVLLHVANEAIQMHGGIGLTDEHEIGFFLKRARVAAHSLGDAPFHRDRYARLSGF